MMSETPIEMYQLPEKIHELFDGRLPESSFGTSYEREKNFLSRALAAFALHKLANASLDEAVDSIVDGGGDGGIDAIFFSQAAQILWIVQSKYIATGRGEPELGDVAKFKSGLEHLLQGNFSHFQSNAAWRDLLPRIEAIFNRGGLQVRPVLVYSGINVVSEDRRRLFEDLKYRFSAESDYLEIGIYTLTSIHDWLTGADQGQGVDRIELRVYHPGWLKNPYETVFGLIPLHDIANLYAQHGKRLIAANIRGFKGRTDVNEQILNTIHEEPQHFFYLNNGITAYCERLEVHNLDRANPESKRITAYGMSIVNGAQTIGTAAGHSSGGLPESPECFVFIKLISLQRCENDHEFAELVTRSTNFQNQIGLRDFVSLDEQQENIARQLLLANITYHYKQDVNVPNPDNSNFTLEEATTASASLAQQNDCDFCARILANRQSLLSMEEIYPDEDLFRSRYARVFRPDRSARMVWRAVQAQRIVIKTMQDNARASTGIRKAFFENARWLVLNVIFLKLHPQQGEDIHLSREEEAAIIRATVEFAEDLFNTCEIKGFVSRRVSTSSSMELYEQTRHFRSVFCTASDCQILRSSLLARLANTATTSVQTS